ncbi:hypothetical protein [Roseibium aggregatum]|jgi:hypothetical protein|uniref:Uncharacterized protein n=1 Tax=Roseibium aggregatum TaxID=187304 RepID=A0A0M6Y8E0_9HYPH|nr:hypothetical protein [Roseibium aggregatum]MEE2866937.1 hypothetical protein [Pseudomonadota bacterium]CTQ45537.1 hypothetical protein LAL4801_03991 [Roseibium aggregatum]
MTKITLTGWDEGFNKVQFNHFLRAKCDLGLADAKTVVEQILQNECVELEFKNFSHTDEQRLIELGVKFERHRTS